MITLKPMKENAKSIQGKDDEWEECMAKTAILGTLTDFHVFESILLENGEYFLLDRHLARLKRSCLFFGLPFGTLIKVSDIEVLLAKTASEHAHGSFKVRIAIDNKQIQKIECDPVTALPEPYTLIVSSSRVDPEDPFIRHKTNRRRHIDEALAGLHDAHNRLDVSDVILVNARGELTESSRANIILEIDGIKCTPHHASGLLPGVFREELLERNELTECVLYPVDLKRADKIYIVNSVRKQVECRVILSE